MSLIHSEITDAILASYYEVYNELGPGFLESVYQRAMQHALGARGLSAVPEQPIKVLFRGITVGEFRADLLVDSRVIVELKAAKAMDEAHSAQLLNYLMATDIEVGLLLNFGPKAGFRRLVLENSRKKYRTAE